MTLKEISDVFHIYYGTLLNWKKNKDRKKLINFLQSFSKEEIDEILNNKENKTKIKKRGGAGRDTSPATPHLIIFKIIPAKDLK